MKLIMSGGGGFKGRLASHITVMIYIGLKQDVVVKIKVLE